MTRSIRVRLALSYAGIAMLATICLGAVLLFRLRAYYARTELDYLNSNAKAISGLATPMLIQKYSRDIQEAQVNNLAFLSQTRVRILDPHKNVLADSGPWQSSKVGFGVVKATRVKMAPNDASPALPSSVIVLEQRTEVTNSVEKGQTFAAPVDPGGFHSSAPLPQDVLQTNGQPDVVFFGTGVSLSNGVYGTYISREAPGNMARSDQKVLEPITGPKGTPLGYVELSEGPAYGGEIVNSVASGLAVAGGLAISLAILAGFLTSRRLTAPLLSLTQATQQMSSGDLAVRVSEAERADEYGRLGKSFNQMAARIEETIQTLRRFLADAAHELQTPLTALRTNLELAREVSNNPAAEPYLLHALEQIERLQRLIKDLLSLSYLESGNERDSFRPVDLIHLIRESSELYAARAEQANIAFHLELPAGEAWVLGSPEKLRSALGNLLDNALKFTAPGGTVTVHLTREPEYFCLAVADTGIGIPKDEVEMVFNRFHRAKNASSYPGSGLGLAIVHAIVQAHSGTVQLANQPQGGARITLRIPDKSLLRRS